MVENSPSPIRAVILDMDGVLWRNTEPIGNLPAIFAEIERRGWKVVLATNNATRTTDQYVEKLSSFGVDVDPHQIINSAETAGIYLSKRYPQGGPVYIIGEEGLHLALSEYGFFHTTAIDEEALAVVVCLDRDLTYEKLRRGTLLIRSGVPLIGTNPDRSFPTPEGLVPGAGAILAALQVATDESAVIMGKPQPEMFRAALERLGVSSQETLVIGDRLETDIAGGQALECQTALVLSGVSSEEEVSAWKPAPDWVATDLTALLELLEK